MASTTHRPRALGEALRAAAAVSSSANSSDTSLAASDSPSEEDYDELAAPPAEAMVLRHRLQPTQLRHELKQPDEKGGADGVNSEEAVEQVQPLTESSLHGVAGASGISADALPPSSRLTQHRGRRPSATVVFEETDGAAFSTSASTTVATATLTKSTAPSSISDEADDEGGDDACLGKPAALKDDHSFVVSIDDPRLAQMLREDLLQVREELEERRRQAAGLVDEDDKTGKKKRSRQRRRGDRFRDFVFTRKFSAFDRQNADASGSPFYGFFTLFWLSVFLFMVKIAAENWRKTGNPLGTHEMMSIMFHRDVVVLLASDGMLCALTGVSWLLQRAVLLDYIDWDRSGWVLQNVWQTLYVAGFIGWTQLREWPWSHTVFFVMHGLVMLMKQHSYAFYNGYLSTMYKRRKALQAQLDQVQQQQRRQTGSEEPLDEKLPNTHADNADKPTSPEAVEKVMAALQSGRPLPADQVPVFARVLRWEMGVLTEELRGKATQPERGYPHNLTAANHYEYIPLPTVVYELEYPRSESINWRYAAEKLVACFGIIFVMISISQATIYPIVMRTLAMKEAGMPMAERMREFPWMMSDLIFPFMMEYLLSWYLIWETILNFLAELTYFADRSFYSAWWNSVTWDEFARDWNRPVHLFLLRHVYHSSISAMKVNRHTATLITFFLSACVHELVMWCIFKKLRGYLLVLQMFQLPLVRLSRTKFMRNRQWLGNIQFWLGIFMGPSMLCSLYLIL